MSKRISCLVFLLLTLLCVSQQTEAQIATAQDIAKQHNEIMMKFWGKYLVAQPPLEYPLKISVIVDEFIQFCKAENLKLSITPKEIIFIAEKPYEAADKMISNKEAKEFIKGYIKEMINKPSSQQLPDIIKSMESNKSTLTDKAAIKTAELFIEQIKASLKLFTSREWAKVWNDLVAKEKNQKAVGFNLFGSDIINIYCSLTSSDSKTTSTNFLLINEYSYFLPEWAKKLGKIAVAVACDGIGTAIGSPVTGAACTAGAVTLLD